MKTFIVKAILTQALELEVKAKDRKEAMRKADRTPINDWLTVEDLGFEIESVEQEDEE